MICKIFLYGCCLRVDGLKEVMGLVMGCESDVVYDVGCEDGLGKILRGVEFGKNSR